MGLIDPLVWVFTIVLILTQDSPKVKKIVASKLCCTLGPSSRDFDTMSQLLLEGMKASTELATMRWRYNPCQIE